MPDQMGQGHLVLGGYCKDIGLTYIITVISLIPIPPSISGLVIVFHATGVHRVLSADPRHRKFDCAKMMLFVSFLAISLNPIQCRGIAVNTALSRVLLLARDSACPPPKLDAFLYAVPQHCSFLRTCVFDAHRFSKIGEGGAYSGNSQCRFDDVGCSVVRCSTENNCRFPCIELLSSFRPP